MGIYSPSVTTDKIQRWARNFRGVQDRFSVMTSPPTVTVGGSTSTINGHTAGIASFRWDNSKLTTIGTTLVSASLGGAPSHITMADSTKTGQNTLVRTRFLTDAPKFEAVFRGTQFAYVGAVIDGQYIARSQIAVLPNDGTAHNILFDFGADTATYALRAILKSAGGTGYVVGDTITLAGGTGTPTIIKVIQVSAGAVSFVDVITPGSYSIVPTGTITQASTSGVGTGATFVSPTWEQNHTTRRMRRVELLWHGSAFQFLGVNVNETFDSLQQWKPSIQMPRLVVIGDSITAGTYLDYPGSHMGASIAQSIGLWDNLCINAVGGTGWVTVNTAVTPNGPAWNDPLRIADFIAQKGDIYLIMGSQNDAPTSAVTAAVTGVVNQIHAALPGAYIVATGPWVTSGPSAQTASDFIAAGYAAVNRKSQVRYIDNIAAGWLTGTGKVTAEVGNGNKDFYVASDGVHPNQAGLDYLAAVAAAPVSDAILDIVTTLAG